MVFAAEEVNKTPAEHERKVGKWKVQGAAAYPAIAVIMTKPVQ